MSKWNSARVTENKYASKRQREDVKDLEIEEQLMLDWIERTLGREIEGDHVSLLEDGMILCELFNAVRPQDVGRVRVRDIKGTSNPIFVSQFKIGNLTAFLQGVEKMKIISKIHFFNPKDVANGRETKMLITFMRMMAVDLASKNSAINPPFQKPSLTDNTVAIEEMPSERLKKLATKLRDAGVVIPQRKMDSPRNTNKPPGNQRMANDKPLKKRKKQPTSWKFKIREEEKRKKREEEKRRMRERWLGSNDSALADLAEVAGVDESDDWQQKEVQRKPKKKVVRKKKRPKRMPSYATLISVDENPAKVEDPSQFSMKRMESMLFNQVDLLDLKTTPRAPSSSRIVKSISSVAIVAEIEVEDEGFVGDATESTADLEVVGCVSRSRTAEIIEQKPDAETAKATPEEEEDVEKDAEIAPSDIASEEVEGVKEEVLSEEKMPVETADPAEKAQNEDLVDEVADEKDEGDIDEAAGEEAVEEKEETVDEVSDDSKVAEKVPPVAEVAEVQEVTDGTGESIESDEPLEPEEAQDFVEPVESAEQKIPEDSAEPAETTPVVVDEQESQDSADVESSKPEADEKVEVSEDIVAEDVGERKEEVQEVKEEVPEEIEDSELHEPAVEEAEPEEDEELEEEEEYEDEGDEYEDEEYDTEDVSDDYYSGDDYTSSEYGEGSEFESTEDSDMYEDEDEEGEEYGEEEKEVNIPRVEESSDETSSESGSAKETGDKAVPQESPEAAKEPENADAATAEDKDEVAAHTEEPREEVPEDADKNVEEMLLDDEEEDRKFFNMLGAPVGVAKTNEIADPNATPSVDVEEEKLAEKVGEEAQEDVEASKEPKEEDLPESTEPEQEPELDTHSAEQVEQPEQKEEAEQPKQPDEKLNEGETVPVAAEEQAPAGEEEEKEKVEEEAAEGGEAEGRMVQVDRTLAKTDSQTQTPIMTKPKTKSSDSESRSESQGRKDRSEKRGIKKRYKFHVIISDKEKKMVGAKLVIGLNEVVIHNKDEVSHRIPLNKELLVFTHPKKEYVLRFKYEGGPPFIVATDNSNSRDLIIQAIRNQLKMQTRHEKKQV